VYTATAVHISQYQQLLPGSSHCPCQSQQQQLLHQAPWHAVWLTRPTLPLLLLAQGAKMVFVLMMALLMALRRGYQGQAVVMTVAGWWWAEGPKWTA